MGTGSNGSGRRRPVDDTTLTQTAGLIRALFVAQIRRAHQSLSGVVSTWGERHMTRWDGGTNDQGTFQSVWVQIARLCIDNEYDPTGFVSAQFRDGHEPPKPNMLLGAKASQQYEYAVRNDKDRLKDRLRIEEELFLNEVALRRAGTNRDVAEVARSVIRNPSLGLSALFRYCKCRSVGDKETAKLFKEAAFIQYLCRRKHYDAAWGDFIPQSLRKKADAYLEQFGGAGQ